MGVGLSVVGSEAVTKDNAGICSAAIARAKDERSAMTVGASCIFLIVSNGLVCGEDKRG